MFGRGGNDDGMSQKELMELRRENEREQGEEQLAQSMVGQAVKGGSHVAPGYWDTIGNADIERDEQDGLGDFTATEMSDKFALGNIKYDDWESWNWRTENEFWVMKNEFRDGKSNLDDVDMATMYGETRPVLTNEKARRLRSAQQVKKLMTSLSVGARGLRSGTEIHAVTKNEREDQEPGEADKGYIDRAKSWLGE